MEESAQNLGAGKMSTVRKIEVPLMADRIALMKDGVVQKAGTSVKLYDKPLNRFVADFLGTANFFEGKLERSDGEWVFQVTMVW